MPIYADLTVYAGVIAAITTLGVSLGIAVAIVYDYRTQRQKLRRHA